MTVSGLNATELGRRLRNSAEFAIFDLRDGDQFGTGAPLYANNVVPDDLAVRVPVLVPRKDTLVALVDADGSRVEAGARVLEELGYGNVVWLVEGLDGNERLPVLPILIARSRAISGEVERHFRTPVTTAAELLDLKKDDIPHVVLDTRSVAEYESGHVPGSIPAPGGEILARFHHLGLSPDVRVILTCAGRSRAVLGAQTLIDAGVPNPISTLDFGTHGWTDLGQPLSKGPEVPLAVLQPADIAHARNALASVAAALPEIDPATLTAWQRDVSRTTYALDVRLPEDFEAEHLPDTVSAPGGQLGIHIDDWVAVQGARLVLVDDLSGVRAATTGRWFKRQGWDVFVLRHDFAAFRKESAA